MIVSERDRITRLVEQYLDSIPDDEVLAIVGKGTFSAQELREQYHRGTSVGERLAQMVLDGVAFTESGTHK